VGRIWAMNALIADESTANDAVHFITSRPGPRQGPRRPVDPQVAGVRGPRGAGTRDALGQEQSWSPRNVKLSRLHALDEPHYFASQ
jgi:hypothetical protein